MAASRVPAVLTALTTTATTALAATTCKVYRGPFVTGDPGTALFIGYDGDPAGEFRAVQVVSQWAGLGAKARDEQFDVACAITLLSGSGDVAQATDDVYALHTLFEAACRADPALSQAPRLTTEVAAGELFTMPHPSGLQVVLSFTVRVSARI
jgi:hypothetical protein